MLSESVEKRVVASGVLLLLVGCGLWWFLSTDRGGEVVEREAKPLDVPWRAPAEEEIVRSRRRPPREDRPLVEPVTVEDGKSPLETTCEVVGLPPGARGAVLFPGGMGGRVITDGETVRFQAPEGVGRGRILFDGYGGSTMAFTPGGTCTDVLSFTTGPAVVTGVVKHADGRPAGKVWVQGCWNRVLTDLDGSYYLESRAPSSCQVRAYRRDGVFTIWSDPADVSPKPGADVVANLELPPYQTAGLGAEVNEDPDGIALMRVLPGGAAAEAGLVPGDVIVEIDGEPTTELSLREFVERALGPEGTEVELVLAGEPERVVELRRLTMDEDGS